MDYVCTDRPIELAARYVADTIKEHLSRGEKVLWLITGGSGIPIAVQASQKLENTNLSKLFVTITDERYGPVDHKNENWRQLLEDGLILPRATLYRPLIGQDVATTTQKFNDWLVNAYKKTDYKLGIFGLGSDGHTAGIKPNSPAVAANDLVTSFHGEDFDRVTISFTAIKQINEAVVQASGDEKIKIVHDLTYDTLPFSEQPAQILKIIPKMTIYSNNPKEAQK